MEKELEEIDKIWSHPETGFISKTEFYRRYGKRFSKEAIEDYFFNNDTTQVNSRRVKNFQKRHYTYVSPMHQVAIDIADFSKLSEFNDGFKYILIVIDIFSRYVWVRPLKSKDKNNTLNAFKEIVKEWGDENLPTPELLQGDMGGEFVNKEMEKYLNEKKIKLMHVGSQEKAVHAERFIRTLREKITLLTDKQGDPRYIDDLYELVMNYNRTVHSATKFTPENALFASLDDRQEIIDNISKYYKIQDPLDVTIPKFKVFDYVRVTTVKKQFEKEKGNYTGEIFQIYETRGTHPPTYLLKDLDGEPIQYTFYEQELKLAKDPTGEGVPEDIVQTRRHNGKKQYLIKWKYYPAKFNSWEDADKIDLILNK